MGRPGASRRRITQKLSAAYAGGLLSHDTFALRLDETLRSRLIDSPSLIGDLTLRRDRRGVTAEISALARRFSTRLFKNASPGAPVSVLLALDWSGEQQELSIGRHDSCDVVLDDPTVSRRHARLVFRDAKWIVQDLRSTNGTIVNGARVGRCEIRPGDHLALGDEHLQID